jgi:hypothetical protein
LRASFVGVHIPTVYKLLNSSRSHGYNGPRCSGSLFVVICLWACRYIQATKVSPSTSSASDGFSRQFLSPSQVSAPMGSLYTQIDDDPFFQFQSERSFTDSAPSDLQTVPSISPIPARMTDLVIWLWNRFKGPIKPDRAMIQRVEILLNHFSLPSSDLSDSESAFKRFLAEVDLQISQYLQGRIIVKQTQESEMCFNLALYEAHKIVEQDRSDNHVILMPPSLPPEMKLETGDSHRSLAVPDSHSGPNSISSDGTLQGTDVSSLYQIPSLVPLIHLGDGLQNSQEYNGKACVFTLVLISALFWESRPHV